MDDKLNIHLKIADRSYPLTVERDKEEIYRRAEQEINRYIAAFRASYRTDTEGYIALTALQLSLHNLELQADRSLGKEIDALTDLDKMLGDYLNKL